MIGKRYSKWKIIRHDIWQVISSQYWLFLLMLAAFSVMIPFSTAGLPGQSVFNLEVTHGQMKFRFIHEEFVLAVQVAAVLFGIVAALSLFKFLRNKRDTTIFMSLGMNRWQLFADRSLVGVLMLTLSICIPMAISFLLNKMALGIYPGEVEKCVYICVGLCLTSYVSFFVVVLSCALSGTLEESILFATVLEGGMTIISYGSNLLLNKLVWGGARGITTYSGAPIKKAGLVEVLRSYNPLTFFYGELKDHSIFLRTGTQSIPSPVNKGLLVLWAIAAVVIFVAAFMALKYRKAEITGMTGGNIIFSEIVIAVSAFFVSAVSFSFFYDFFKIPAYLVGAAVFLVVHIIWRKTLFSYEMSRKNKSMCAITELVAAGCFVLVLSTNGFGHTLKVLNHADFVNAECSFVGSPDYLPAETLGSSTGNGYYVQCNVSTDDPEEIKQITKLNKEIQEEGKKKKELSSGNFSETVVPYDIEFSYTDSMGKEYYYYYDRASLSQLADFLVIDEFDSLRKDEKLAVKGELNTSSFVWAAQAYKEGEVYLADSHYTEKKKLELTEEDRESLINAIAEDSYGQSAEDRYYPDKQAQAVFMFTKTGEHDQNSFAYHLNNTFVYVTDEFTNTLAWMTDHGMSVAQDVEIESITLQKFNPYENVNGFHYPMSMYFMSYCSDDLEDFLILKDFGKKYTIIGQEEIRQLKKGLRNTYFMDEGGYLAAVKVKGCEGYAYMFLPESEKPDFVVE